MTGAEQHRCSEIRIGGQEAGAQHYWDGGTHSLHSLAMASKLHYHTCLYVTTKGHIQIFEVFYFCISKWNEFLQMVKSFHLCRGLVTTKKYHCDLQSYFTFYSQQPRLSVESAA